MFYRFTLATISAAVLLAGCAKHQAQDTAADFTTGPSQLDISHIMTRTDDGSSIFLTVDGKDAGMLHGGEKKELRVAPGKHQVGGYVQTLFGFGRVTIAPTEITAKNDAVTHVAYSVKKAKPQFAEWTPPTSG